MKRTMLLWLLRSLDPALLPAQGECLVITRNHEACPLWQLAQDKKIVRKQQHEAASL